MSLYHNRQGRHSNSVDADVSGIVPGGIGELMLGVRNDAGGSLVSNDQEFTAVQFDSSGRMRVVTQGGAGGTSAVDEAGFTAGVDVGTPAMGVNSTDTVGADEMGILAMDASRRLLVSIEVDNVGIGGGTQYDIQDVQGATNTGTVALVVRNDTLADLSGGDGAYALLQVNAEGSLYTNIKNNNLVSTNNSSASTLTAASTFTGTSDDISMYSSVSVQVFASHASAADGLSMEFSTDGTNWDEKHLASIAVATEREFIFPVHAKFFRVVYTNGGTNQTAFRLQTILHVQGIAGSSHSLDDDVAPDSVGTLVKAMLIAQAAGTGDFIPMQATTGGNLKVAIEEADTSATGLAKAEDVAFAGSDVGVMALGVRDDVLTDLTPADGDYTPHRLDSVGQLHTTGGRNFISTNNTTMTPLGIDAVFTGTGDDISNYSAVTIHIFADEDSAASGISIQFSTDNTNWDEIHTFTLDATQDARVFQFPAHSQYFRIVYTNGGTEQAAFRLQTILHKHNVLTTIHRVGDDVSPDRSSQIVKSVVVAQAAGTGNFVPVQATAAGNFKMSLEEIDGALLGGGVEDDALLVTIANDSTGVVTVDNASIDGPGAPVIVSYTHTAIALTTGADQVLASSAADRQIWVYGYGFTCGSADDQSVSFQDEDDTPVTGVMEFAQYGGISVPLSGNFAMPVHKLATDKDLEVDILGGDVDGWIAWALVDVS